MHPLYYDPAQGVMVSNVCGYGHHAACDMKDNGCEDFCHAPPVEPEPPDEIEPPPERKHHR